MALTAEQIAYANECLDWFNTRIDRVETMDPWKAQGEIGPTLVTVNRKRDILETLNMMMTEVHAMEPRCGCGTCGR